MANNTVLNVGSGGDTLRTIDKTSYKVPTSALDLGGSGAESLLVFGQGLMAASVPVTIASNQSAIPASQSGSWTVTANAGSGTFTVSGAVTQSGTWNVGTVTTVTTVSAVTAISNALPAGTNLLGSIATAGQVGTAYSGTTALTPKYAAISAATSGASNTLVAAVTSKKITVLKWHIIASGGAVNVKFQSNGSTDLTGLMNLVANQPISGAYCPVGHFQSAAGESLSINLSGAVQVSGYLVYLEV